MRETLAGGRVPLSRPEPSKVSPQDHGALSPTPKPVDVQQAMSGRGGMGEGRGESGDGRGERGEGERERERYGGTEVER